MTTLRQAAQQALEALHYGKANKAVTILREALAQPEQKPMHPELRKMWEDYFDKCFRTQPEQEPVVYDKTEMNSFVIDLYDLKMREGKHGHYEALFHVVHCAIEAAHNIGEKT